MADETPTADDYKVREPQARRVQRHLMRDEISQERDRYGGSQERAEQQRVQVGADNPRLAGERVIAAEWERPESDQTARRAKALGSSGFNLKQAKEPGRAVRKIHRDYARGERVGRMLQRERGNR